MPAGRGNQCAACYYANLAEKRTAIDCAAFESPALARHFRAFGEWLKETRGPKKAAHTIHRFLPFFLEIEREWGSVPDYHRLLSHFGASNLRKVLLAVRWMEESGLVVPDAEAKEADSDGRRIQATLDRFPRGTDARASLSSYHDLLDDRRKSGRTSIRSVRLALAAAADLLATAHELDRTLPDQKTLDTHLTRTPGQRAALSGFVSHLRHALGSELRLPPYDARVVRRRRHRKIRDQVLELMRTRNEAGVDSTAIEPTNTQRWIAIALAYFHDVPTKVANQAAMRPATVANGGLNVVIEDKLYWIPPYPIRASTSSSRVPSDHSA